MSEYDNRELKIGGTPVNPGDVLWETVHKRPVEVEFSQLSVPFEVETLEGTMEGDAGDVLIRGVEGELYPCDFEIFVQTYIQDSSEAPKYSHQDIREARQEFMDSPLDHVPEGVTDTDAKAGVRAFLSLLSDQK